MKYWCGVLALFHTTAWSLTLAEYQEQVKRFSPGLAARGLAIDAAKSQVRGVDLMTAGSLSLSASKVKDEQPGEVMMPDFEQMNVQNYDLAMSKMFSTGTKAKLALKWNQTEFEKMSTNPAAPPADVKDNNFSPTLELSQSLWQNFGGRSYHLQKSAAEAGVGVRDEELKQSERSVLSEAEAAFFSYLFAKERLAIAQRTRANAEDIYKFVKQRFDQNLYEKSDLLQAEALVAARNVEVLDAEQEFHVAGFKFNSLRGDTSSEVKDEISGRIIDFKRKLKKLDPAAKAEWRVMQAQLKSIGTSVEVEREKTKPEVELFGSYGLKSAKENLGEATSEIHRPQQPKMVVGLSFKMALDPAAVGASYESSRLSRMSLERQSDELRQGLERGLGELTSRWSGATKRYETATSLVDIQKRRLDHQQSEFRNGRSTTYQLLLSAQDLADAELSQLRSSLEVVTLQAQLAQYEVETP